MNAEITIEDKINIIYSEIANKNLSFWCKLKLHWNPNTLKA